MKVIRLKAKAYASEVISGKTLLSDVPQRLRVRNYRYYILALNLYKFDKTIPDPLDVLKSDLEIIQDSDVKEDMLTIMKHYTYVRYAFAENILSDDMLELELEGHKLLRELEEGSIVTSSEQTRMPLGKILYASKDPLNSNEFPFEFVEV